MKVPKKQRKATFFAMNKRNPALIVKPLSRIGIKKPNQFSKKSERLFFWTFRNHESATRMKQNRWGKIPLKENDET
ncbi:hypothetical protein [Paenibacillus beijingensis]|uniref:Uncharacterized protein n=1 Tax=Paenibacillus beijingensis TaxID=1126833 RepID=A0A0D5NI66_9BACL|nr:hypothetical protein [Paenibacillus beijingensis]AJY74805.1 hypothetical protein VN24_09655 [Paenibacillus beijingensis]